MINVIDRSKIDIFLILSIFFLFSMGIVFLYSATDMRATSYQFESQIIKFTMGMFLIIAISHINPVLVKNLTPKFYLIVMILLVLVPFTGTKILGAKRWLDLYIIQLQPSELVKIALPAMIAFIVSRIGALNSVRKLSLVLFFILVPTAFIISQPDLGTTLLIIAPASIVILCSGLTMRFLLSALFFGISVSIISFKYLIKDYQMKRIETLFNPESDPMGSGYHIIQSKIAIGSGGFNGKGFMEGTQSQLSFIPEQSTDFILAVFLEETGFLGFLALSIGFFMLIGRMVYMTSQIQDIYAKLFSISITSSLFIYFFVNIGMVIGILPVVGVPLPFFSYGGSSMLTNMICIGLVMNFYKNRNLYQKQTII